VTYSMDDQIDPVAVALNGAVARLHHILRRIAAQRGGHPAPLPDAQVELLLLIQRRPGISVKEAAEALRTAPNTVSTLVGDLVGAGLLERGRDPHNRRVVRLELTDRAHLRLGEYLRRRQVILAEALAMLDATAMAELAAAVLHLKRLEDLVGSVADQPAAPADPATTGTPVHVTDRHS
jgi:DNA-binding MarR family transcriptional regulator